MFQMQNNKQEQLRECRPYAMDEQSSTYETCISISIQIFKILCICEESIIKFLLQNLFLIKRNKMVMPTNKQTNRTNHVTLAEVIVKHVIQHIEHIS